MQTLPDPHPESVEGWASENRQNTSTRHPPMLRQAQHEEEEPRGIAVLSEKHAHWPTHPSPMRLS